MCVVMAPWLEHAASAAAANITSARRAGSGGVKPASARAVDHNGAGISISAAAEHGISPQVLTLALGAVSCAVSTGAVERPRTLTLIDYSRPSNEPRLWVLDFNSGALLF